LALEMWRIDPAHSCIHFAIRYLGISKIHGRFTKWGGTVQFDEAAPTASQVEVRIDATSVDTNEPNRDGHLQTPDFFNTAQYPEITFKSMRVEAAGKDRYRVTGDLSMRGMTKSITLEVEHGGSAKDPWGNQRGGFSLSGAIDRRDFGLSLHHVLENGAPVLGETVEFSIDLEAVKVMQAATS
jgi:polyisoprenoid-binding protein YceI